MRVLQVVQDKINSNKGLKKKWKAVMDKQKAKGSKEEVKK